MQCHIKGIHNPFPRDYHIETDEEFRSRLLNEYKRDPSAFDLQVYSDYKYYGNHSLQYDGRHSGAGGASTSYGNNSVMKWFSKWDNIKKYTPLFDSGYLDRIRFAYNGDERYDYSNESGRPESLLNSIEIGRALFGIMT